jgi:hypothetical protein
MPINYGSNDVSTSGLITANSGNFTQSLQLNGTGVISSSGGTTNYISKFTGGSTIGNSLVFDNGTNVGIGTSSPAATLEINGPLKFTNCDTRIMKLDNSSITISGVGNNLGHFGLYIDNRTTAAGRLYRLASHTDGTNGSFRIRDDSAGADRLIISSNGNVGIGTSSPSSKLQVSGLITANSGNFTNLLTVNGTGVWHSGNFDSSNIVRTIGTQTISGVKTFSDGLKVVGNGAGVPIELGVSQDAIVLFGKTSNGLGIGSNSFNFSDSSTNVIDSRELLIGLNANDPILTISRGLLFAGNSGVGVINYYDNGVAVSANRLIFDVTPATTLASANTTLRTTTADGNNIVLNLPNTSGTLALLTSINTTQITGTLPVNKGGTNITSYSNGQLLIGSGTSLVANTLSAGTGIAITNGSGTITINTSGLQTLLTNPVTGTGTGASTSGYLPRWNSTSGLNNSDIYQSGSNIGIGTVTPSGKLHVSGTIIASGGNSTNWNTAYGWGNHAVAGYITNYIPDGITIFGNDGSNQNIVFENDGAPVADITWDDLNDRLQINALQVNITAENGLIVETDSPIQFNPNGGGNVGIGIVNPTSKLHVAGDILATGSFIGGSGTASLPSFEFINDPDTGLFSPAANTFGISTSGAERLRVSNIGNVGIGTSSPGSPLTISTGGAAGTIDGASQTQIFQVNDASSSDYVNLGHFNCESNLSRGSFMLSNNGGNGAWQDNCLQFFTHGSSYGYGYYAGNLSDAGCAMIVTQGSEITKLQIGNFNAVPIEFFTSNTFRMMIDSGDGNVGIGTSTPQEKLDVDGNININGSIKHTVSASDISDNIAPITWYNIFNDVNSVIAKIDVSTDSSPTEGMLAFHTNDGSSLQERVRITDVGNVGIGTSTPAEKLDVVGNVNIDGNLTFDSYTESVVSNGNSGASKTLSLASGTVHTCTLTGNCTFTMPTATAGKSFSMFLNSGSGNYTASFSGVRWADSAIPTATITASKVDIYSFISDGSFWYGSFSQNYG